MMRSMYSGVSGLKNHQTRMDVIGNNIANINTAGYKKSRVVFKDTLYQTMRGASSPDESSGRGGTNAMGIGLGMAVSSIDQIHSGAPTMATNSLTDMAIDGNGYFVIRDGNQEYYTRAGNFEFDTAGSLVDSSGYKVMGWMATINPVTGEWSMDTSPGMRDAIDISGFDKCAPQASKEMLFSGNMDAEIPFNEVQTLAFAAFPDGGNPGGKFRLSFSGQYTEWIEVGANTAATAANIEKALENLGSIGEDNVAVSWNPTYEYYEIKFQGDLASRGVPPISLDPSPAIAFTGGDPVVGGTTQNVTLYFDDGNPTPTTPEGDPPDAGFTITVGNKSTGVILLAPDTNTPPGVDTTATAANITAALAAIGHPATVTWDNLATPNCYNIAFNTDPGQPTQVQIFDTAFNAGAGTIGKRPVGATTAHVLSFGTIADGGAAGGVFRLSYNGENTNWIEVGADSAATAANMQSALGALSSVGPGNIAVNWNDSENRYEIKTQGALAAASVPTITVTAGPNIPYDGTGTIGIAQTTQGVLGTTDEEQTITLDSSATQGAYVLSYNGMQSDIIPFNATAAQIETALQSIPGLSGVTVTMPSAYIGDFDVVFPNSLGDVNLLTVTELTTGFTGGAASITPPAVDVYYPTDKQSIITSQKVYDSLGESETIYFRFFKYEIDEGPPRVSRWAVDMSLNNPLFEKDPGYDAATGFESVDLDINAPIATMNAGSTEIIRLTNLQFDDNGRVVGGTPDLDPFNLTINRAAFGSEDIEFKMDFSLMTQYAGSSVSSISQNGYQEGSLISYTVGIDGVIRGSYDNGESRDMARVALARFQNPAGLTQVGGTIFQRSVNSGEAIISSPTVAGMGRIVPSSLEMSNVDLSEEFTDMIVTQRGFQANSRIITTSDEMIQELVNLKR